jgi:hypothetical protein
MHIVLISTDASEQGIFFIYIWLHIFLFIMHVVQYIFDDDINLR